MPLLDPRDPAALARPIVRGRYCLHLVELMREQGVPEHVVLDGTGLDPEHLSGPDARISYAQQLRIYENAQRGFPAPGLGFLLARRQRLSDHGVFGYAVQSCADLAQAARVTVQYVATTGPLLGISLEVDGERARIVLGELLPLGPIARMAREEALMVIVRGLLGQTDPPTVPEEVWLDLPDEPGTPYERELGCPVRFGRSTCEIRIGAADLTRPLTLPDEETASICERRCAELLERLGASGGVVDEVRRALVSEPGRFPGLDEVARTQGMSGRTLRRRLNEAGTSFQEVVEDVRKGLALDYLERSSLPIDEIASLLGYSETPNFYRAFKKWTGRAPSAYR